MQALGIHTILFFSLSFSYVPFSSIWSSYILMLHTHVNIWIVFFLWTNSTTMPSVPDLV